MHIGNYIVAVLVGWSISASKVHAAAEQPIPDFSGYWARAEAPEGRTFLPPESGPGPVMISPDAPRGVWAGDATNPILQPPARAAVEAHASRGSAGDIQHPAWVTCWPVGVPLIVNMNDPIQFLQTPEAVTIIYERDNQVRRIYLNEKHPVEVTPTWYGHSVGHYESDNMLIVDTRGQNNRALVDRFGTPRSEQMRVVERYTIRDDRTAIDVSITIEDPNTFTTTWTAQATYWLAEAVFREQICAENNRDPNGGEFPMPHDTERRF